MLLLLSTSALLVLCCDRFDSGSRQVKCDPVDLVKENYDITIRGRIEHSLFFNRLLVHKR